VNRAENAHLERLLAAVCVPQTSRMIPDNFISVLTKGSLLLRFFLISLSGLVLHCHLLKLDWDE